MNEIKRKIACFKDVISGVILIVICIILYTQTFKIKKFAALSDSVGPRFFPRVILVVLAFLAVLLVIGGIVKGVKALKESSGEAEVPEKEAFEGNFFEKLFHLVDTNEKVRAWISIGGMFIFVLLMPALGFAVSATLYLFIQFTLLAPPEKRWKRLWLHALLAAVFGVGSYLLFKYAIRIQLPAGILKDIL